MKVSLRFFLLLIALFAFADFSSLLCRAASNHGDYAGSVSLGDDDAMGQGQDPIEDDGSQSGDDEDEYVGITLINHTGVDFYVYRLDPDDDQTVNILTTNGASVTLMDDETDFYVNTPIPSNGLELSSFGIRDGDLHPGSDYTVELYDEVNGRPLFDASHHPVWHMRFTEVAPAPANGQMPHVFTIVRPK